MLGNTTQLGINNNSENELIFKTNQSINVTIHSSAFENSNIISYQPNIKFSIINGNIATKQEENNRIFGKPKIHKLKIVSQPKVRIQSNNSICKIHHFEIKKAYVILFHIFKIKQI